MQFNLFIPDAIMNQRVNLSEADKTGAHLPPLLLFKKNKKFIGKITAKFL